MPITIGNERARSSQERADAIQADAIQQAVLSVCCGKLARRFSARGMWGHAFHLWSEGATPANVSLDLAVRYAINDAQHAKPGEFACVLMGTPTQITGTP